MRGLNTVCICMVLNLFQCNGLITVFIDAPADTLGWNEHMTSTYIQGARWSSGINAANGACGPLFASRILPTVQRPWTSR